MKNNKILLTGLEVYTENEVLQDGFIYIENGVIKDIGKDGPARWPKDETEHIHFEKGKKAVPGFIDLHIHGAGGADVMDASIEALDTMTALLPKEGTTAFLATTMTSLPVLIEKALLNTADYIENRNAPGKAEIIGVHLEGPFLCEDRSGAQNPENVIPPDIELFDKWQDIARGLIKTVTLAPEKKEGLTLIRHLAAKGIIPSIGHSDASHEVMLNAIASGAKQATHLFNGMSPLHHRDPGVAGTVLMNDALKAEIIADGIHVHPTVIDFVFRCKGKDGILLITDSMRAKCMGNGTYDLGGQMVTVEGGKAVLSNGVLAGSMLKLNEAARNMMEFTNCNLRDIILMASVNPAKQLGIYDRKGSIDIGKDADIVIMAENFEVERTFCKGAEAFKEGRRQ